MVKESDGIWQLAPAFDMTLCGRHGEQHQLHVYDKNRPDTIETALDVHAYFQLKQDQTLEIVRVVAGARRLPCGRTYGASDRYFYPSGGLPASDSASILFSHGLLQCYGDIHPSYLSDQDQGRLTTEHTEKNRRMGLGFELFPSVPW